MAEYLSNPKEEANLLIVKNHLRNIPSEHTMISFEGFPNDLNVAKNVMFGKNSYK
jgi:hypothetical protein